MKKEYLTPVVGFVAGGMLLASTAMAHEAGKANNSYVGAAGGSGHYVTDSSGSCVRTGSWKVEDMTVDCGAEPPKAPTPPPAPVYEKISLSATALFDFDKAVLKPEGREALDAVGEKIKSKGASVVDIDIVGHTDSIGSEEYNQGLSERRANAVRDYIVSKGVDGNIIDVSGAGESSPVADNSTKEGRAQNRRVEVSIGVKAPTAE
jgi:OOP family OmpA-OmpF porin